LYAYCIAFYDIVLAQSSLSATTQINVHVIFISCKQISVYSFKLMFSQ